MPIATKKTFKCKKCDYEETRIVGDCLPDANSLKPCSKCGADWMHLEMKAYKSDSGLKSLKKL